MDLSKVSNRSKETKTFAHKFIVEKNTILGRLLLKRDVPALDVRIPTAKANALHKQKTQQETKSKTEQALTKTYITSG